MITYFVLFFISVSVSIPLIDIIDSSNRPSLQKRDLSFQFTLNQPKYDFKATDPDLNPIFLACLLSGLFLEIEREKDYDPKYDIYAPPLSGLITPSNDFKQTQSSWAKGIDMPPSPIKDKEADSKMEEYSRLKKELQSNPDMHLERTSYLSTQSETFESMNRQTMDSYDFNYSDDDEDDDEIKEMRTIEPKRNKRKSRKSTIFKARMSRNSVMTTDSLL